MFTPNVIGRECSGSVSFIKINRNILQLHKNSDLLLLLQYLFQTDSQIDIAIIMRMNFILTFRNTVLESAIDSLNL